MQVMKYTTRASTLEGVCIASAPSQLQAPTPPQGAVKSTSTRAREGSTFGAQQ